MHLSISHRAARFSASASLVPVLCAAVLLFALACPSAVHAEESTPVPVTATPLLAPAAEAGATVLDDFHGGSTDGWFAGKNVTSATLITADDAPVLDAALAETPDGGEFVLSRIYESTARLNLINRTQLSVAVRLYGTDQPYTVRLSLYSGVATRAVEAKISPDGWYAVNIDIGEWHLRTRIDAIEITVSDPTGGLDRLLIGKVSAGGVAADKTADAFLTFGFTADGGTATYENGAYTLDAGDDGVMMLIADAARENYSAAGSGTAALRVVIENATEGGTISLAVSDSFADESYFSIASSAELFYGTNTYLLPFDSSLSLYAYRLSFRGLFPDSTEVSGVRLLSVSLVHLPARNTVSDIGKITACTLSESMSALTVSGTVPAGVVAENIRGTLALYEIPVWADVGTVLATGEPLDTIKISTRFSFSVDLTGKEATAAVSRYAVVILSEGRYTMMASPRFPDLATGEAREKRSPVGLTGATAAGAFAANAANVTVDVYVDRLIGGVEGNTSGRLCIRGGRYYYLDYAYLKELDAEINFYAAADIDVYIRLLCATDLSARGFTRSHDGARNFAFDVTNEDGAYMLSAVTDYIAARYPSLRGFVLGERLDDALYNGADMLDTEKYAALCADTMRIIYAAAAPHIPDIITVAPIGHTPGGTSPAEADGYTQHDTVLLSVLLSKNIKKDGNMPWGLLYVSDNSAEIFGHAKNILNNLKSTAASAPDALLFLWQPAKTDETDLLLYEYEDRCETASSLDAHAFFLDVSDISDTDTVYDRFKHIKIADGSGRAFRSFSAALAKEEPNPHSYTGKYILNDFTRSFSTLDWIAGNGCNTLTTQLGMMTEGLRALHAEFTPQGETGIGKVSGSILYMMPAALDFTAAPTMNVTLLVSSEFAFAETARLTFVLGSDDARAEYAISVPVGETVTVSLNLAKYENAENINSAAILLEADAPVALSISKIVCYSDTLTSDALAKHFSRSLGSDGGKGSTGISVNTTQLAVLFVAAVCSLSAFALLSRRERDVAEKNRG